ncbi:hypothetical protein DL95DRAFT_483930 [Leptodontidium sp. 2 PMI_412]|nr:hypothetical protein DL95DRAFT_483930 [Leptodontidium sp. 2 PMI_412]
MCTKLEIFLPSSLKACGKFKSVRYCSVECQKKDGKTHKLYFTDTAAEKDVYSQLIDAFRLRLTDELEFNNDKINNENVNKDILTNFNTFLYLAEKTKDSLFPVWWSTKSREERIALATEEGGLIWERRSIGRLLLSAMVIRLSR